MSVVSPAPLLYAAQNYYIKSSKKKKKKFGALCLMCLVDYISFDTASLALAVLMEKLHILVASIMDLWDDLQNREVYTSFITTLKLP